MVTFSELKNKSQDLYPAILLDKALPYKSRKRIRRMIFWSMIFVLGCMFYVGAGNSIGEYVFKIRRAFFMFAVFYISTYLIEWFYLSYYVREHKIDFEVAYFALTSKPKDLTAGFLNSEIGEMIMRRLNISSDAVHNFLKNPAREKLWETDAQFVEAPNGFVSLIMYLNTIYDEDNAFAKFLSNNFVDERKFLEASQWSDEILFGMRKDRLILARVRLERIPSIGKNWAYYKTRFLQKFGHPISESPLYRSLGIEWRLYRSEAEKIENLLVQKEGQNVMMIVPSIDSGMEIVSAFAKIILKGYALYKIEGKEVWIVDYSKIALESGNKEEFEANLKNILIEAHNTVNVILVFPKFSNFTERAYNLGVQIDRLFAEFLKSSDINIIALAETNEFHQSIETHVELMQSFAKIEMRDVNLQTLLRILKKEMSEVEKETGVFFTYQALHKAHHLFEGENMAGDNVRKIAKFLRRASEIARADRNLIIGEKTIARAL